jgi:hypothetical protein
MRQLQAAIGGAVCVTLLWYIAAAWAAPVWGAHVWWLHAAGLAAVAAICGVARISYLRSWESSQAAAARQTADELGLTYAPTVERPAAALPCLEHWGSGEHGHSGEIQGVPVRVFDLKECISSDEGTTIRWSTKVLLPAVGLPELTAAPLTLGGLFDRAFGLGGMTFDPAAAPPELTSTVRRFGRAVRIEYPGVPGPMTAASTESLEREAAIRRVLSPALMAALLEHRGWSFQTGDGWLACWRGNSVRPARERPGLIEAAHALRAALLAAAADPLPVVLPSLPRPTAGQYGARMLWTFVGVILGLAIGFFEGIPTGHNSAWANFVPVFAGAGAVLGGMIGYRIGVLFGRLPMIARWTAPPASTPVLRLCRSRE